MRCLLPTFLTSLVVLAACAAEGVESGPTGNTEINLDIVAPGSDEAISPFSIDRVDYRITCDSNPGAVIPPADTDGNPFGFDDSVDFQGSFEVVDTRFPPVWQAVMDLPPGDCTITLSVYEDDEIVCAGSQTLAINDDGTTKYDIVLVCSLSIDLPDGMADVDGTFDFVTGNVCPKIYVLSAFPSVIGITNPARTTEIQYRAKDPDNSCGNNCDPQSCTGTNPPVCTPYPSNINDRNCNPVFGGDPNDPGCLAGDHAGLVCTIAAIPTVTGVPGGTFINPLNGAPISPPVLPVNLNTAAAAILPGLILPGLGGPIGTDSEGSPIFQFPTDSLPPLIYICDAAFGGQTIISLDCSDGDLECDQNKQIVVTCTFPPNFCEDTPTDCSAPAGGCITGGTCIPACDPSDIQNPPCTGPPSRPQCDGFGNPLPDGTLCTEGGGQVCSSGTCVECLVDADCASLPAPPVECQLPNACSGNSCVGGGTAPAGTPCDRGGGLGPGECDGVGTGASACQFVVVDPVPASREITQGCTNNLTPDISILSWTLTADPGPILDGSPVAVDFTGIATFTEVFLDAALQTIPGLDVAALAPGNRGGATIVAYGGGLVGPPVEVEPAPIPTTCEGGMNAGGACVTIADCPPVGYFQCLEIFPLPQLDGTGDACAACNALGPPKDTQCADNGFCIPGPLELPLDDVTGSYAAVGGSPINLGWDETNQDGLDTDGTYILSSRSFSDPWQPGGLRVLVGFLQVALNCVMAVDSGGPDGVGVPDQASPTPTANLLNDFVVQIP